MRTDHLPPALGAVAGVAAAAVVAAPYVLVAEQSLPGVWTYYDFGLAGPWIVGLFGLVCAIAFEAGRRRRTPGETVAGVTLALGLIAVVLALQWAMAVPRGVVVSIGRAEWLAHHRWAVVAVTAVVPASAAWYARTLRLF